MSANKRRRSNSNSSSTSRMGTADQMNTAKDVVDDAAGDNGLHKFDANSVDNGDISELLEMPRVCRCCCKGDMELLSLFETSEETDKLQTSTKTQRRRKSTITATDASEATQQRKSDNPVEYALSSAHSSMDIVREEMIIWMLNVSKKSTKSSFYTYKIMLKGGPIRILLILSSRH